MKKPSQPRPFFVLLCLILLTVVSCGKAAPESTTLEVRSKYPTTTLEQGRSFDVEVSIANTGQYNAHITEIHLPASFLNKVSYQGSEPALTITNAAGGEGIFYMDLTIAPNGVEKFTFRFATVDPGSLSGLGLVVSDAGSYQFNLLAEVVGTNPAGWEPGTSPTATSTLLAEAQSIEKIPYKSVVQIKVLVDVDGEEIVGWTGSGTIISRDGLILTNAHVVLSDRFYQVKDLIVSLTVAQDSPPVDTYLASIVQANAALDIAVIKVRSDLNGTPLDYASLNLPAVPLGNSDTLQLGDRLTIIGYPGIGGETITLTQGEVSGFTAEETYGNRAFIKTSATIAGGNSGGLAVNENGELVGVPTQVGSGGSEDSIVDCRPLADTNRDGYIDDYDSCVPTGGFINALRPVNLAVQLITEAQKGIVMIDAGATEEEAYDASGQVIFQDDFSDPNSGWGTLSSENGTSAYENGEMTIYVKEPNYLVWSDVSYVYEEIIMTVDARVIHSVGDADFGFICGLTDNSHFTVLEISEDGYYTFWKQQGDEFISLIDWTYSDEIAAGGPFVLSAYCGTSDLVLAVNGVLLGEYQEPEFTPGAVGVVGGTFDNAGFKVAFDNFELLLP